VCRAESRTDIGENTVEDITSLLILLFILTAIAGAVAFGISIITRKRREFAEQDPGVGTVRRLYFYTVSFAALTMSANGISLTLEYVLDTLLGGALLSPSPSRLALATGLALIFVGVPLWGIHWRIIRHQIREHPVESKSVVRKIYLCIFLAVSVAISTSSAIEIARWSLGNNHFYGGPWAGLLVWSTIWFFHWRDEKKDVPQTAETWAVRRLYVYVVSTVMLVTSVGSLGLVVHVILRTTYESLFSVEVIGHGGIWGTELKDAISSALIASALWGTHWLIFARGDFESTLRQLYIYVVALLGGISTVLAASGVVLYGTLVWLLGSPENNQASEHFRFLPGVITSILAGGSVLAFHGSVARKEASSNARASVWGRRSYPYGLAALGLAVMCAGSIMLINTILTMLDSTDATIVTGHQMWRNWVIGSVTLITLGGPLWWHLWSSAQNRIDAGDLDERQCLPRRILIFGVLGVGMLILLGSVSYVLFVFLRGLLDGNLSTLTQESRGTLSVVLPVGVILTYYWMVYRVDRKKSPDAPAGISYNRKAVTAFVRDIELPFIHEIESALGYQVDHILLAGYETDQSDLSSTNPHDVAKRISDTKGSKVLIVPDSAGFKVFSYN